MELERNKIILNYLQDRVDKKKREYYDAIRDLSEFYNLKEGTATDPLREQRAMWEYDMEMKENAGQGLKAEAERNKLDSFPENRRIGLSQAFFKKMEEHHAAMIREREAQIMFSSVERYRKGEPAVVESGPFPELGIPMSKFGPEDIKAGSVVVFGTIGDISEEAKKYTIGIDPVNIEPGSNVVANGMKENSILKKECEELKLGYEKAMALKIKQAEKDKLKYLKEIWHTHPAEMKVINPLGNNPEVIKKIKDDIRNDLQKQMIKAIQDQGELCIREFKLGQMNYFEKHGKNVVYLPKSEMDEIIKGIYKTEVDIKQIKDMEEFIKKNWYTGPITMEFNIKKKKSVEQMIKDNELPEV